MVSTRMEARVDTLEKEFKEIREQVGMVDSRVGALTAKVDRVKGQLGAITEFMREIRNMMKASNHGKNTEVGTSPVVMEVQSATPRLVQKPTDMENKEQEKTPEPREITANVTSSGEEGSHRRLELPIFSGEDPFG